MFEWLSARDPIIVYIFLLFNACIESLFPPYPSDAFVLVFAFLAGQGDFNPYIVYVCTITGSITGIMILFYIGRSKGHILLQFLQGTFLNKIFPIKLIEKARKRFEKRGDIIVVLNRFLPGMRAPICFAAGITKIRGIKVFLYSLISVLLWNLFLVTAGFYVGSTWHEASVFLRNYNIVVTLLLILLLSIFTVIYFRKIRKT